MKAGPELNVRIAEEIIGYGDGYEGAGSRIVGGVHWLDGEPFWERENGWPVTCEDYSGDIAAAWEVHKVACDWLFSERRKYFKAIQRLVSQRMGDYTIAWPDVLLFIEPADFCLAALEAKDIGVE